MQHHGIVIVHAAASDPGLAGFGLDCPRHRAVVDRSRGLRLVGWTAPAPGADAPRLVLRADTGQTPLELRHDRPDVARRLAKEGRTLPPGRGFDAMVPDFAEACVVACLPGRETVLTRISVTPMDAVSDAAHDHVYLHQDVPMAETLSHANFWNRVVSLGNRPGLRVLEVGSRAVTAQGQGPRGRERFDTATYVGFDYYPGKNVDVVGDAHRLSAYFDEPFDLIISFAVLEHLAMPWVAAVEMAKCLKLGGHLALETHFSFSSHERPWHFFQCSDMALRALFSPALGFECLEAGASNPIVGRFSSLADPYLRGRPVTGLYCHSEILCRKTRDVPDFDWSRLTPADLVGSLRYPEPESRD